MSSLPSPKKPATRGARNIRVLFLSANVGAGHQSAANAVSAALHEVDPHLRAHVVDSYKYAALVVARVVSDGYLQMVKTIPQMYRYVYERAERATEVGPFRTWAHQFTAGNLRALMLRDRPDVVVCTHAFPCGAMAEYKRLYADAPPVAGIVTDFAVHGFWVHSNVDGYAVADDSVRAAMIERGARPDRILATGIPIDARFAPGAEPRAALRERLELPPDLPLVLMMGGGLGIAPLAKMLGALENAGRPLGAVVIAGRDARQERRVLHAAEGVNYPVRVLRFVDNVYDYMHACDAFVTKPGGLSVAEALAARIPIVLCKPLPGQEERNVRFLVDRGAATDVQSIDELGATLASVLGDRRRRDAMIGAAARAGRPHAARDAASFIAGLASAQSAIVA